MIHTFEATDGKCTIKVSRTTVSKGWTVEIWEKATFRSCLFSKHGVSGAFKAMRIGFQQMEVLKQTPFALSKI